MRCVHTHQRITSIEECGSPSCIWSIVEKIRENNWKTKKTNQFVSQGQNVINFKHNGPHLSCQKTYCRGYDGAYVLKWNLEVEPFVARWVVQKEEDMCKLGVVEDRMSPWGVVGKRRCCC